jgi:integrase
VVKCVLEDAATKWRDEGTNLTWLAQAPYINCTLPRKKRQPYPLSWEEQRLMFDELQPHSQCMSEFCTNTGARDEEICALEWGWEIRLPELDEPGKQDTPGIRRSAFIIPAEVAKNRTKDPRPRLLVLNDAAQLIVESARGEDPQYVFTYEDHRGNRDRMYTLRSSGWVRACPRRAQMREPTGWKWIRVGSSLGRR